MDKKKFNIVYKTGKKIELKDLNLEELAQLKRLRADLYKFIHNSSIFKKNPEDSYNIYIKETEFKQLVDKIYNFLDIKPELLQNDDIIDLILPWEERFVDKEKNSVPKLHTSGKIFEYLIPYDKTNQVISTKEIHDMAKSYTNLLTKIRQLDKKIGDTILFCAQDLKMFSESENFDYNNLELVKKELKLLNKLQEKVDKELKKLG